MGKPRDATSAQCSTFVHFLRHRGRCLTVMRTGPVGVASVLGRWSERETNCHYRVHAVIRCPPSSCARERADDDDLTRTGGVGVASVLGRRREREGGRVQLSLSDPCCRPLSAAVVRSREGLMTATSPLTALPTSHRGCPHLHWRQRGERDPA